MPNKIKIHSNNHNNFYLCVNELLNTGNYSDIYTADLKQKKKHNKSIFKFFICNKKDDFEMIDDKIVVKLLNHKEYFGCGQDCIKKEVNALLELKEEPHIINIFSFDRKFIYDNSFVAIELCEGGDLFDYVMGLGRNLLEDEIRTIIKHIALGIKECHKHKIVHGDIKLENIGMYKKNDLTSLKLLDFGGSYKIINDDKICKPSDIKLCASPHYIPPELIVNIVLHERDLIFVDFWEFGVLLYALITKTYPYHKRRAILFNKIKWPKDINISKDIKDFVEKLLEKKPTERINIDILDIDLIKN